LDDGKYLSRLFEKSFRGQRLEVNIFVILLDLDLLTLNYTITLHVDLYVLASYLMDVLHCDYWVRFLFLLFIYLEFFNFGGSHELFPNTYWRDKAQPTFIIRIRRDISRLEFYDRSIRMIIFPMASPIPTF
jgi:hypothetical protein